MRSNRGYTLFEVMIVLALIGIISAIGLPVFLSSNQMNSLWTTSERVGAIIRETRLKAITRNANYEVRFECPAANKIRGLIMTGNPVIDNAANRCDNDQTGDTEIIDLPLGFSYNTNAATALQVSGRGVFTPIGAAIPLTISVTNAGKTRYLTVSATGQITFNDTAPAP